MNPGLESLRLVHVLEVHGRLYLKREVNILCVYHDLIPEKLFCGSSSTVGLESTGGWEQ